MPSGQAMTKASPVKYWELNDMLDMSTATIEVLEYEYTGTVGAYKDGNGLNVVELNLQGPQPHQTIRAHLGDVLVWDGRLLQKMRIEVFQDQYDVEP